MPSALAASATWSTVPGHEVPEEFSESSGSQQGQRPSWKPGVAVAAGIAVVCVGFFTAYRLTNTAPASHAPIEIATQKAVALLDISGVACKSKPVLQLPRLPPKPVWVNRGWNGTMPKVNLSERRDFPVAREIVSRRLRTGSGPDDCSERIKRFDALNNQDIEQLPDPMFKPVGTSIASPHENCGDTAQGIKEACAKFNHWASFNDVARARGSNFMVFGPRHVEYHDIGQGQLGTCYFLAAVASVAYSEPQVIKDMFVDQEKWKKNIFTTRWLLNGKVSLVEVDDMIPAHDGHLFFVQPSKEGEFWPIILEKTWSKIFTSFKAAEAGFWENVVSAITRAPTRRYHHDDMSKEELWMILQDGTKRKLPMAAGAGMGAQKLGMVAGHAYSVFRCYHSSEYGDVVEVFNPWHRDYYKGIVPNHDHGDGSFTMTFDEYRQAFDTTSVAVFRKHYKDSYRVIQREARKKASILEFEVPNDDVFYVSLNWPSQRMVKPCKMKDPKVTLAVARADNVGKPTMGDQPSFGINSATAKVTSGAGKYIVLASAEFPDGDFIDQVILTVYASSNVSVALTKKKPALVGLAMFGPTHDGGKHCAQIMISGRGLFMMKSASQYGGVPTYWSFDGKEFAYFVAGFGKWFVTSAEYWPKVQNGELWHVDKVSKSDLTCGCADSQGGVAGFLDVSCDDVLEPYNKYSNVKCTGEYATHVKRYCPWTCGPLDACADWPEPEDEEEEAPDERPDVQLVCEDHEQTGITINHGESMAKCEELKSYCFSSEAVQQKCCSTCLEESQQVELTNGGEGTGGVCYDDATFKFTVSAGQELGCIDAKDYCDFHESVRERCCDSCQKQAEADLHETCFDDPDPGIIAQTTGADTSCPNLRDFCWMDSVQESCCSTCRGASSWTSWLPWR